MEYSAKLHFEADAGGPSRSGSASSTPASTPVELKRRRITRACDRCHRGGTKCSAGPNPTICGPCAAFGSECTYQRPMRRRGPAARNEPARLSARVPASRDLTPLRDDWTYVEVTSHEMIDSLIDTYHRVIYPIHPFFHWPTFTAQIRRRLYTTSRSFHCLIMSVAALTSARLRDGAPQAPRSPSHMPQSEAFYRSAQSSFPIDLTKAGDFDYKRAKTLLAMLCIQYGQVDGAMRHVGDYLTLCAIDGFHNEARWPNDLTEIELQERRRLFWSAYQIDVYTATTWGGIIRQRESQISVLYPAEVHIDEDITPNGILPPRTGQPVSFLSGWNFTTNLYRILEHAVSRLRTRQHHESDDPLAVLFVARKLSSASDPGPNEVLNLVETLFSALPEEFKRVKEMTGNPETDRYGFQAANILITLQTVKMVMAGMAEWSVAQRCAIAGELLDSLATVPKEYVRSISSPMLHHLAGVGHLLASIIHSPLSHSTYLHVRTVLLNMADLLSSLESHLSSASGIALKLREQVERIDIFMAGATTGLTGWGVGSISTSAAQPQPPTSLVAPPLSNTASEPLPFPSYETASSSLSSGTTSWSNRLTTRPPPIQNPFDTNASSMSYNPALTSGGEGGHPLDPLLNPQAQGQRSHRPQNQEQTQDQQIQLPNDLFTNWSYMFGEYGSQGDAFDFLNSGSLLPMSVPVPNEVSWQPQGQSSSHQTM